MKLFEVFLCRVTDTKRTQSLKKKINKSPKTSYFSDSTIATPGKYFFHTVSRIVT